MSVSSRPAWSPEEVPGYAPKLHWEPSGGCWELNWVSLEEQPVLLTAEPSLQPDVSTLTQVRIPCLGTVERIKKAQVSLVLVAHAFNPSTREAEAGGSLWVPGQPGLQSEFPDRSQSYTEKPCPKKTNQQTKYYFYFQHVKFFVKETLLAIEPIAVFLSVLSWRRPCLTKALSVKW